jgi:hypothetical protein
MTKTIKIMPVMKRVVMTRLLIKLSMLPLAFVSLMLLNVGLGVGTNGSSPSWSTVGKLVGLGVGPVGELVGEMLGASVGVPVVGEMLGASVGVPVVGEMLGASVGVPVVGESVGADVLVVSSGIGTVGDLVGPAVSPLGTQ